MTASSPERSKSFPGWPSGDFKGILQLREPLNKTCTRVRHGSGGAKPEIRSDDDHDGLGPYSGFHLKDREIGYVVFVRHAKSPVEGTDIIVDAKAPVDGTIARLQKLLDLKAADIKWVHPESKLASALGQRAVATDGNARIAKPSVTTVPLSRAAAELAEKTGMTKRDANNALGDFVGLMVRHLKKGDKVRITGLGILQVRNRPARMGRNPATGEAIKIKASKKVAFRVAKDLKDTI
jgi:DNA-binding protein HU-beta